MKHSGPLQQLLGVLDMHHHILFLMRKEIFKDDLKITKTSKVSQV